MSDNPFAAAIAALSRDAAAQVLSAAAQRLGGGAITLVSRETAHTLDDLAEIDLAIPQWTTADGQARGVRIRALRYKDRMLAEQKATIRQKDGSHILDAWRLMAEEVTRGIVAPRDLSVDTILEWNDAVVETIHAAIQRLAPLPAQQVAAELSRLAGGDPPPVHDPAVGDRPDLVPDELGGAGGAEAGGADGGADESAAG